MNIFFLDTDPLKAAQMHSDVHLRKMIIETAQLLSTAHWVLNEEKARIIFENAQNQGKKYLYRKTHLNHPCAQWVRKNKANYRWTAQLGLEMLKEFEYRFGKPHASQFVLEWLNMNIPDNIPHSDIISPPVLSMPEEFRRKNPITAYRNYYLEEKYKKKELLRRYTRRDIPKFILQVIAQKIKD